MHTVFLALGSNLGDKKHNIANAITTLSQNISDIESAQLYETKPMYYENQDIFINTVIKGQTQLSPLELFTFVKLSEQELGRKKRFQNGPREIDIDILFYDQLILETKELIVPHPRINEREFVLQPFNDLEPDFFHPVLKKTMRELYNELLLQTQ